MDNPYFVAKWALKVFHDYQIAQFPQIALVLQSPHQTGEEWRGSYRLKLSIRLTGKWTSGAGNGQIQYSMLDWDNNLKPYGTSRTVEVAMGKKSVSNLKDTKLCGDKAARAIFLNFFYLRNPIPSITRWVPPHDRKWFLLIDIINLSLPKKKTLSICISFLAIKANITITLRLFKSFLGFWENFYRHFQQSWKFSNRELDRKWHEKW